MTGLWLGGPLGRSLLISLSMPGLQHNYYGAPSLLWVNATVAADGTSVAIDLQVRLSYSTRV